jgi:hypothetical protein
LRSELQNLPNASDSFAASVERLTGGDNGRPGILVWVIGRQTKDITSEEVARCAQLFSKLQDAGVITDGAASTERGEKKGNLHLQCCLWCPSLNRNNVEVMAAAQAVMAGAY